MKYISHRRSGNYVFVTVEYPVFFGLGNHTGELKLTDLELIGMLTTGRAVPSRTKPFLRSVRGGKQ